MATRRRRKRTPEPKRQEVEAKEHEELEGISADTAITDDADLCKKIEETIARYRERIKSPLTAIRAFCVECMGGAVREIASCTVTTCPLYPLRMGKNAFHTRFGKPRTRKREADR